jgi:hypothetical protein
MKIVDMARSQDFTGPDFPEPSPYPYGLRINLNKEDLAKLGITEMPAMCDKVAFYVYGAVCSTSESQDEYGETRCVGIQIQKMALEEPPAEEEAEDAAAKRGGFKESASKLYPKQG